MDAKPVIGIVGGAGDLGSGLARRWAAAGYRVVLGSRTPARAAAAARDIATEVGGEVRGASNVGAANDGDVVVLAVPYSSHSETLREIRAALAGKILVDAVVPLVPPKVSVAQLPKEGSAAQIAQTLLGAETRVVSAFHNVGAAKLHAGGKVECDILVFGDDKSARETVIHLADVIGSRGVDGGALANSAAAEAMTTVLIGINRRYKIAGAGIRISGLPNETN